MSLTLNQLRNYHRAGKSIVVLNHIKTRVKESDFDIGYKILYAEILFDKGQINEALEEIESLNKEMSFADEDRIKLDLIKAEILTDQGQFSQAQYLLKSIKTELGNSKNNQFFPRLLLVLGKLNYFRGNIDLSQKLLTDAKKYIKKIKSNEELGRINVFLAQIYRNKGMFSETLNLVSENESLDSLSYLENLETKLMKAQLHIDLSDLDEAKLIIKQIESKIKAFPFIFLTGIIYQLIGNIYKIKGKYNQALAYLTLSEDIFQAQQFKYFQYQVYQLLGEVNLLTGNFSTALENFQKALSIATQLENNKAKALVITNISKIVQFQGNIKVAEDYLRNALKIISGSKFPIVQGKILFFLGSILLSKKETKEGRQMIENLQQIFLETRSPSINLYMSYLQALDYFYKPRFIDKEIAKQSFLRILNSPDADTELKINAALRLSQLLIIELKMSESQELLQELNIIEERIDEVAERENSLLLQCFLSVLRAKIALINFDINRYKEILDKMKTILKMADNKFLIKYIDQEEQKMEEEFLKWYDVMKKNPSFIERLEKAQVLDYISEISKLIRF